MSQQQRTLLIVDDSPEDRELYRRYLLRDREYSYTILEATLGQQGLELWQQHQPDAVLLDYRLPDLDGLEFLAQLQPSTQQPCLPVIVVTGQGNEAIAVKAIKAGAQDYLVKEQITPEGLQIAVNGAIETVHLRTQLQQRIERERVVSHITQKIHQSLNLDEILQTIVAEVREFLHTDRVLVFQLKLDDNGTVVAESVGAEWRSLLSSTMYDPCLAESYIASNRLQPVRYNPALIKNYIERYYQGQVTAVSNIYDSIIDPCDRELLAQFQVKAHLIVPILQDNQFWGLLIAHHCTSPRFWQPLEIDLLKELATQMSIALRQAELYQQAQRELKERQQAEQERDRLLQLEQAARAEAERANQIKDEFLAILSHELRSPLNPILGWTKLLQTRKFSETKMAEALATIERNAKLQTQLIDDLLDIAKILRGKLSIDAAPVNLAFVIESALDTVNTAALSKSIVLHSVLPNIGQVSGDSNRLQQIVWNLLSNAIKFTPKGGRVETRLERVDEWAQIIVSDTGKGINSEFLPYIFESFRQEDVSITRKYGGLGLGLAIVRQLVEAHGGTITANSPGEGLGATFTVQLPLLNVEPEIKQPNELPQQALELTGIRILTVDDDPDARELLTVLLAEYGAKVLTVASATEVLANLESFQPDILVSDIGMAEVDGYSLIKQIRTLTPEKGGEIPAIALTAYARVEDSQRAISSGYQRHVTKPLNPEELVQAVVALAHVKLNHPIPQND
ncbi:response regulator [Nostoc sp.]|uniref:response regulator n=1 Tax=Nostoc sp. TaxID=1180 RepID=UPI002FF5C46E